MDIELKNIDRDFYYKLFFDKIDNFLKVYIEYYYLSNIKLRKESNDSLILYNKNESLTFNNNLIVTLLKEYISLTGIINIELKTSFFHDTYYTKLLEIHKEQENNKITALFENF